MTGQTVTVVVCSAGSAPAQAFIRALRGQEELAVRLVGLDDSARSAGLFDCDRRYTIPRVGEPDHLEAIEAICAAEGADVLVPIADFELETLADAAGELEQRTGTRTLTNSPEAVRLAVDKRRSAAAVAAAGVAVPRLLSPDEVELAPLPVVAKPLRGAGSQGVSIVRERGALAPAIAAAGPQPLVQSYVAGDEFTVDLVVAPDGRVLAAAPRVRVEVRAGQSYKSVTVDDPDIDAAARAVVRTLGITAQANVQFIRSVEDGRPYFIECNPKFAAAMGLTIGAGLNIPLLYVKLALGRSLEEFQLTRRAGMWLLRSWQDRVVAEADIDAVSSWRAVAQGLAAGASVASSRS